MAVLGLSILIATFSFFCYRHPPSTWVLLEWFRERNGGAIGDGDGQRGGDAPKSITPSRSDEVESEQIGKDGEELRRRNVGKGESGERGEMPPPPTMIVHDAPSITTSIHDEEVEDSESQIKKEATQEESREKEREKDRKAMPPPPPPTFKTSSPPTPRARLQTPQEQSIPSFTLGDANDDEEEEDLMPPPQFPAVNSAQRAGGGATATKSIPRLSAMGPPPPRASSSLMAPPQRGGPLPNRNPSTNGAFAAPNLANGLTPPPTHTIPPPKPRKKVLLTPGHSPLDWASLASSSANLTGLPPGTPLLKVPPSLLKTMNGRKGKDAWTVLGGKVYNITPYADYHPGGVPELMRCAGRDGTKMFAEVHPWVNWGGMLEACWVGMAVEEGDVKKIDEGGVGGGMEDMD